MTVALVNQAGKQPDRTSRDLASLRRVTGQVVGSVFFGTLLKTMRQSVLRGPYGHGGRGEDVFAAQLDAVLAERAGTAVQRGLGEALYARLRPQQERMTAQRQQQGT